MPPACLPANYHATLCFAPGPRQHAQRALLASQALHGRPGARCSCAACAAALPSPLAITPWGSFTAPLVPRRNTTGSAAAAAVVDSPRVLVGGPTSPRRGAAGGGSITGSVGCTRPGGCTGGRYIDEDEDVVAEREAVQQLCRRYIDAVQGGQWPPPALVAGQDSGVAGAGSGHAVGYGAAVAAEPSGPWQHGTVQAQHSGGGDSGDAQLSVLGTGLHVFGLTKVYGGGGLAAARRAVPRLMAAMWRWPLRFWTRLRHCICRPRQRSSGTDAAVPQGATSGAAVGAIGPSGTTPAAVAEPPSCTAAPATPSSPTTTSAEPSSMATAMVRTTSGGGGSMVVVERSGSVASARVLGPTSGSAGRGPAGAAEGGPSKPPAGTTGATAAAAAVAAGGAHVAVEDLWLSVPAGQCLCLLGRQAASAVLNLGAS